jgi:bifunctional non-homologous end joining protein LigD
MEKKKGNFAFVIQKHKATSLHYDFRLQIGEVMPSWSIPRGPSLDNTVKRLALPTTDHSMEYRNFEGVIPEGQYGAGPVMIWDTGTYNPEIEISKGVREEIFDKKRAKEVILENYKKGNFKFTIYGEKLSGSFALVLTKGFAGRKDAWLLIKHLDKFCKAGYDAKDYDFSAVSNLSIAEIENLSK